MSRLFIIVLSVMLAGPAWALAPGDYAYGMPLKTTGNKPFYELPLPAAVYQKAVDPQLHDLQIFNAAGESLPFRLQQPAVNEAVITEMRLPFFPVQVTRRTGDDQKLQVELNDAGRITAIHSTSGSDVSSETIYIIDTRDLAGTVESLDFSLTTDKQTYVQRLRLDTGSDLNHWSTLVEGATLARLRHGNEMLQRTTLSLSRQPEDYLRLSWMGESEVQLESVNARIRNSTTAASTEYQWQLYEGQRDSEHDNVFHFQLDAFFPVSRLNLQLPETNILAAARFESRSDRDAPWQLRTQERVYRLRVEDMVIENDALTVVPRRHGDWRVTLNNAGTLSQVPRLKVGWRPQRLQFLARGPGPYVLAFGRGSAAAAVGAAHELLLLPAEATPGQAQAGQSYTLGGERRLEAAAAPDWRQITLWAVLLVAVLLLGVMAWRLWHDIGQKPDA